MTAGEAGRSGGPRRGGDEAGFRECYRVAMVVALRKADLGEKRCAGESLLLHAAAAARAELTMQAKFVIGSFLIERKTTSGAKA
jgi:hypothetical protein